MQKMLEKCGTSLKKRSEKKEMLHRVEGEGRKEQKECDDSPQRGAI